MDLEQRQFRADPLKLKRLRVAAGLTVQEFAEEAELDRTTVAKILRGDPVFLKSIKQAGEKAFGIDSPLELLHPDELQALGVSTEVPSPSQVLEWDIAEYLSGWEKTSNGLQYQRLRLKHRYLENRWARAKCYELRHLPTKDREQLEGHLRRHVEVSEQVGSHPNVAENLTAAWVSGLWWVLDRWVDGETLAGRLSQGPLSEYELQVILGGMARGLKALHAADVSISVQEAVDVAKEQDTEFRAAARQGRSTCSHRPGTRQAHGTSADGIARRVAGRSVSGGGSRGRRADRCAG